MLIDADNASAKTIDDVLQAIEKLGKITTKKIYGDWSMTGLSASWQEAILRHAIDPMQQFAYVKGKNATDIALVIEAMDLLHGGEYDGFCLVSSNSDFASLAVRIRKGGVKVFGFGRKEAVTSFRQACDEFFEVENLKNNQNQNANTLNAWDNKKLKGDTKLLNALRDSVAQNIKDDWASYAQIASYFKKHHGDIDITKYGYKKLIEIYQVIDLFSINTNKETKQLIIKLKDNGKKEIEKPQPAPIQKYTSEKLQADQVLVNAIKELIANNQKAEQDWVNISYIASELGKNPQINVDKYGYKKFSDLITAIRLFDIKKEKNGVYVKLKSPKEPAQELTLQDGHVETLPVSQIIQKPHTLADITQTPLTLNGRIRIHCYRASGMDSVMWRLGDNKKVRHEGDVIFYGQTQSDDNMILLDNDETHDIFTCQLSAQTKGIRQIVFSVSHESDFIAGNAIKIMIEKDGKCLFVHEFVRHDDDISKSAILFTLVHTESGWKVVPRSQYIHHDLRQLCGVFGIEVDD